MPAIRPLLLVAALALGGSACSTVAGPGDDLRAQIAFYRALWEAEGPEDYRYTVERLCFCGEDVRGPAMVEVVGDTVVRVTYSRDGAEVIPDYRWFFPSVDGLFDILQEGIDENAHSIEVSWDEATGVPLHFFIDYRANMADEELGMRVVDTPH